MVGAKSLVLSRPYPTLSPLHTQTALNMVVKKYEKIDTVQNRAICLYLRVCDFVPNIEINGDMGWICSATRKKLEIMRMWNQLIMMDCYNTCFNPSGTGDLKFYQSQGLSTFWGFFYFIIKPVFYLSW